MQIKLVIFQKHADTLVFSERPIINGKEDMKNMEKKVLLRVNHAPLIPT